MTEAQKPLLHQEFQEIIQKLKTRKSSAKQRYEILEVIEEQTKI